MSVENGPRSGEILGDYRILERLDAGPARRIYKAEHISRNSVCNIEIVSASRKPREPICARLMREIQLLTRLRHPNLISFREVTALPDCTCIVETECLEGETLKERLQRVGCLTVHDALPILIGAGEGLAEAHCHDLLHRALSPDCVAHVPERTKGPERVVLTRFGLGLPTSASEFAALAPEEISARLTEYSAPEQRSPLAEGESLDGRTDIYSLAVIAYKMIAGRLPDEGGPSEAPGANAHGEPVTRRKAASGIFVLPELEALLMHSLARDRSRRPSSIESFLEELKKVQASLQHASGGMTIETAVKDLGKDDPNRFIGSLLRDYRIMSLLGAGGFGAVYRGRHELLGVERAVKVIHTSRAADDKMPRRFLREAKILSELRHSNIVPLHEFGRLESGEYFMVTELVEGETVRTRIRKEGHFSAEKAARISMEAASGLAAAHAKGIVHRDVSPDNVMLSPQPDGSERVVVLDFGIAKPTMRQDESILTSELMFVGKPGYSSPEQAGLADDDGEPDARSDIYSLGVTLYEMLTGDVPFKAATPQACLLKHCTEPLRPPSEAYPDLAIPQWIEAIVMKCMRKARSERFSTMEELIEALRNGRAPADEATSALTPSEVRARTDAPVPGPSAAEGQAGRGWFARYRVFLSAAAFLILSAIVLLGLLAFRQGKSLQVEASLYRWRGGGQEKLKPGDRVRPGDKLSMEVATADLTHVYVLNEDEIGSTFVLFPVPGLDQDNPLAAGEPHVLPGYRAGKSVSWEVTSAGGKETFFVIASRKPLRELEQDLAKIARPAPGEPITYAQVSKQSLHRLRGIGGLAENDAAADEPRRLSRLVAEWKKRKWSAGDVFFWSIELSNPAP